MKSVNKLGFKEICCFNKLAKSIRKDCENVVCSGS